MPKIHYAIAIFTASTLTNTAYGLVSGVFRFVTDRPQYDGSTVIPTYGAGEINPLTGDDRGGTSETAVFYEGFLQKQGITGNPSRSIDISTAGSYSTDSAFQFTLRNDLKFWNFLQDPYNTGSYDADNAINLTGCLVVMWAVIDDVFCQIARGRITNNPYTETDYNFNVEDDATTIHKNIPPQISTYLGLLNNVVQRQQGAVVPVVFGNVPYSPLGTNQEVNSIIQLNPPYYPAAATNYTSVTGTGVYTLTLYLPLAQTTPFITNDQRITGQYLSVIAGDIAGTAAATTKYYKIVSNTVSTIGSAQTVTLTLADPIIFTAGTGEDTVLTASTFNTVGNGCVLNPSSSPAYLATSHTWWFQITNLAFSANVSQNPVLVEGVYSYNSNLNSYDNDSAALQLSATPESNINLIANTLGTDGSVIIFEKINLQMKDFGIYETTESYSDTTSIEHVTDGDRSTSKTLTTPFYVGVYGSQFPIYAEYSPQSTNPSSLNQVLTEKYSAIYFVMDFTLTPQGTVSGGTGTFQIGVPADSIPSVEWEATDISGRYFHGTTTPHISTNLNPSVASSSASQINFLPNSIVKDEGGIDNISLINTQANDTNGSPTLGYTYKAAFCLSADDDEPTFSASSLFTSPQITNIKITLNITAYNSSVYPNEDAYSLAIKEIAVIGERSVNILGASIFARTTGETIANDGSTFANTVYKAFRHILEDYDGIPTNFIDYGDLAESRNEGEAPGWPVSRTLTDQKNSSDYLNELCQHSFVAMFSGRTGKRTLRSLAAGTGTLTPTWVHTSGDGGVILAGSLGDYAKTDPSSLFNCFYIQYAYDPGSQQYVRGFNVNSLTIGPGFSFPASGTLDASGNPLWWSYFSGMQVSATDPTVGYSDAAAIWNLCQAAFLRNGCSKPVQGDISELPWFTDSLIYDSTDSSGSGSASPAYLLLQMLATWATTQKETVSYCIPLNADTITTEMIDIVNFVDALLTRSAGRNGWITGIEYDCNNDQIKITLTLQPLELVA